MPQAVDSYYTAGTVMDTLRVFPTLKKNCYTINNLNNGERILLRASFFYGNYDGKHFAPTFDLLLDGNLWGKVNLSIYSEDTILYREYIYDVNGNSTSLCLAQTLPDQLPLISALELRSLGSKMYRHAGSNHVLSTTARFALGSPKDRLWFAYGATGPEEQIITSAASAIDVSTAEDQPPKAVVQNAIIATSTRWRPALYTNLRGEFSIYINIYFSEVLTLLKTPDEKRSIQLYMDNKPILNPIVPPFGSVLQVYLANITASPNNTFTLGATSDSSLPPLINAYEVYKVGDFLPHRTNRKDVRFNGTANGFRGLSKMEWGPMSSFTILFNCSDLQSNSFDGPIPKFFGSFPNLKLLVNDNCLNGMVCALSVDAPPPLMTPPPQPNAPSLSPTSGTAPPPDLFNTPPSNQALTPSPNGNKKIAEELPIILEATIQIFLLSLLFF
ncbi:uncharacterized protein At1g24485-like [Corylus avellana]|uniref:uncharacterized protein At1g24485-like n=1 Tax=Corylus avellana TaxID=13451 RepID=UPI00286B3549|nr:uncharacterized protein At1g24485-like [Corylus avellana]